MSSDPSALDPSALVKNLLSGSPWSRKEAQSFFRSVVDGSMDPILLAAAIAAIRVRGQTVEELIGAAQALIESATPFPRPDQPFCDIVGTGGDGLNTINLSTIAALTAAACGCPVVKHGNRSITSCSGSFDLLESLGVPFEIAPDQSRHQFDQHGVCFLFAPRYHAGLRHARDVRSTLGVRTLFNLLGPLVNPARPPRMLLGVADPGLVQPMAEALRGLGMEQAFVVHGSGVDEVAIHGPTQVARLFDGEIESFAVTPADFGARSWPLEALICHDGAASHARSRNVLAGRGSDAESDAVCVNVALLLSLFDATSLRANFSRAREALAAGSAASVVARLAGKDNDADPT